MIRLNSPNTLTLAIASGLFMFAGCGGGNEEGTTSAASTEKAGTDGATAEVAKDMKPEGMGGGSIEDGRELPEFEAESYDLDIPMVTYAWDPQAGDASVSAEDGGPGFTGEGWDSKFTFPALGSDKALKGGRVNMYLPSWPATLRLQGKDFNTAFNYRARDLCAETLLNVHPSTLEIVPMLATHWKISEDKSTFSFRLNPEARWSDGKEVTSADVLATFTLLMDERLLFPSNQQSYGKLTPPVATSKYIVEVTAKDTSWRNFLYFASDMRIFPAHQISIPGDEYLAKFQNKYTALTGPYMLDDSDVVMNKSLTLKRRDDWWANDNPAFVGMWNFDEYRFTVVQDSGLAFEKAKKGEFDYFWV
ncbi:MAG: microcin C transport system substrate-binding protein, partial [Planctomycetota bacterium]